METPHEQDTILIVDDTAEHLALVGTLLRHAGFHILTASSAEEGLQVARQEHPDFVISDVVMPTTSGIELCRMIRADAKLHTTPILLMSALDKDTDRVVEALRTGADGYIELPLEPSLLVAKVVRLLERKSAAVELERCVAERTEELATANQKLEAEILERQQAEEERTRLIAILETTTDVVGMADATGHVLYLNRTGRELFGLGVNEDLSRTLFAELHSDWAKELIVIEGIPAAIRDEVWEGETTMLDREGREIPHSQVIIAHKNMAGEVEYISTVARDITERKQAEEALRNSEEQFRQSQKMEAIGTLAGGVAHDFNNLLQAILGNTHLALRAVKPDDPLQLRLVEVEKAANRAAVLTRQLLAFSRRQHLERHTINLNDTINEIMKLLRRIIGEDVEVRVIATPGLSAIFADPAQIEQVIMNLAVNARDAMPQGGTLTIETGNVELDESYCRRYPYVTPGKYVQISVSDTGSGIDAETQKRIFEPFFTTKEVDKGTGLGLSMVYGIVKQHDGHINAYSEVGHGTTFKIFLPIVESEVEKEGLETQLPLLGGTETILVAEDEEALRSLARDILEGLGYTVLLAKNGEEAVEMYEQNREEIDLLLLDVVMPRMGGIEAYERIRELSGDGPLIFMTGYSAATVQSRFVKQNELMGELDALVLQKPYNVEGLGRKVREVLDQARRK